MTGAAGPAPKRSLFKLISDIPGLLADLVRGEIEAFKQELLGKLKLAGVGIGFLVVAATFAFFALLVLIAAAVLGLATVLPGWAAALIIGAGVLLLAVGCALIGVTNLKKGVPPAPTETIKSIKQDVRAIKGTGKRATP